MVQRGVSQRQACLLLGLARSTYTYRPRPRADVPLIDALTDLVTHHPAIGFWMCYHRLRHQGHSWNHKRLYRLYTAMRLNLRRKAKKRLPARVKQPHLQPQGPNQVWSMDFVHDSLWNGRSFRALNILDDYNRQALHVEIDTSLPALRVIRVLEMLRDTHGTLPKAIRTDNGPEFISQKLEDWCQKHHIQIQYIQPGKPTQNAYIERCNRTLREELLNA
jgi:putative transposase